MKFGLYLVVTNIRINRKSPLKKIFLLSQKASQKINIYFFIFLYSINLRFYHQSERFTQNNYTTDRRVHWLSGRFINSHLNYFMLYFLFLSYTIIQLPVPPLINSNTIHRKILLLSPVFGFFTADVDVVVESFFGIVAGAMVIPV